MQINIDKKYLRRFLAVCAGGAVLSVAGAAGSFAQHVDSTGALQSPTDQSDTSDGNGPTAKQLLQVPVTTLLPGDITLDPKLDIPDLSSAEAAQRGMNYFIKFNCVGCHMGNGGGGMGPALSNRSFIYGSKPANIYLSIFQGRPSGMPAWGTVLPKEIIWDIVAYVKNLSDAPVSQWGSTVSPNSPKIEQVPVELNASATPWQHTQPFRDGQKP
jgi:cytochrome c oxidase cbb3-type subunit 3